MEADFGSFGVRVAMAEFGYGVFALKSFQPEETVGRIAGETLDDPDHQSDYCIELDDGLSLEPYAPFRFLNHSCDPNCCLVQVDPEDERDGPEIRVETLRVIRPGEQLTIDYAWPAEAAIPCGCHSQRCRGWIVAEEQAAGLPPPPPRFDRLPTEGDAA